MTAIIIYIISSLVFHGFTLYDFYYNKGDGLDNLEDWIGFCTIRIILALFMPYTTILAFLDWNFNCKTNRDIERMQKENLYIKKFTCALCGRNNFDRPSPHKCKGGFRKRGLKWSLTNK